MPCLAPAVCPGRARLGLHAHRTPGAALTRTATAAELLATPGALLTRSHLAELGLGRAAVDAVFRQLDVVVFPGSTRPHVRREDYLALVEKSTYGNGRVRPI